RPARRVPPLLRLHLTRERRAKPRTRPAGSISTRARRSVVPSRRRRGMQLTPEQEWILVACGLIAHADGELKPGERDLILAMLDERLDDDDTGRWFALLGDLDGLRQAFADLLPPLPAFTETTLE